MSLLQIYLSNSRTQRILNRKPGDSGFSLIELVVVIAVLAVLTAIALPNFLGVSEDASARTAQQGALNAFKECKVYWARNKRGAEEFSIPAITDWAIMAEDVKTGFAAPSYPKKGQPQAGNAAVECFDNTESRNVFAVPSNTKKFPTFKVSADGTKYCKSGSDSKNFPDTYNIGCAADAGKVEKGWE